MIAQKELQQQGQQQQGQQRGCGDMAASAGPPSHSKL